MAEMNNLRSKTIDFKIFRSIVKEFIRALGKGHTYNIRRNSYFIFGILWGIPIPIVTLGIALYYRNLALSSNNVLTEIIANPIHLFFLMHPILFGIVFGAMGTVRDEKEKQRQEFGRNLIEMNKKLKETNKKLKELDELKDNFLSMVSHELWSPLTTVQGYVTFLKDEKAGPVTEKQKELLEITDEQIDNLSHLIGELVDISKIEAGKIELNIEEFSLNKITDQIITTLKPMYEEKNLEFDVIGLEEDKIILADKLRFKEILYNLLSNAVKYTKEGGFKLKVLESENQWEFNVIDTGIGIAEEDFGLIFKEFKRVKSDYVYSVEGTGLGLSLTKKLIELHGGNISFTTKLGEGSTFTFKLPKKIKK